jgi:NNP family nitrate/nitrite transporter-like MFS transporter
MSKWIETWDPENEAFWQRTGKRVARRNLVFSIFAENIGFSVWMLWSIVATRLPAMGFRYTTDELFALVALPGLVGAVVRIPYTFAVPRFGGRNWTVVSALVLLVPTLSLAFLVNRPETPFGWMAVAAATAGLGGGNFASSMANISFFYPDRKKGFALGLNAAGGNIGVSTVQWIVPIVIGLGATAGRPRLGNAALLWVPLILASALCAYLFMDNLSTARSNFREQVAVARRKHTWVMAFLYVGTFGSFVGYAAAFPLLLKTQFPGVTANLAFLGPLVGSIARPLGGYLADRIGGSRVTFWNFLLMGLATLGALVFLWDKSFVGFLTMFLVLFVTTGIGNGSTFRMIPAIFRAENLAAAAGKGEAATEQALAAARRETAAVLGVCSAVGALGGFFIPRLLGASIGATGSVTPALAAFVGTYVLCAVVTWWCYRRTRFLVARAPSLAHADA